MTDPGASGPPLSAATSRSTPRPAMPCRPACSMPSRLAPSAVTSVIGKPLYMPFFPSGVKMWQRASRWVNREAVIDHADVIDAPRLLGQRVFVAMQFILGLAKSLGVHG